MNDTLLTENQVAELTGLRKSRLQKDRCAGGPHTIPFLKLGRLVRYRRTDLEAWMAGQRAFRSTSEYGAAA